MLEDDARPPTTSSPASDHQPVPPPAPLVGAVCALLGGAAWVAWVVLAERQPPCCPRGVGNEFLPFVWWKLGAFGLLAVAASTLAAGRSALPRGLARLGALLVGGAVFAAGNSEQRTMLLWAAASPGRGGVLSRCTTSGGALGVVGLQVAPTSRPAAR